MAFIGKSIQVSLFLASLAPCVTGHGFMSWPMARSAPDRGVVAGGPATVHAFEGNTQTIYQRGVCGNAVGTPQTHNRVGDAQATLTSGTVAHINITITAHHVGYFELELCLDAGRLSEECFADLRLLRHGCACECSDLSHSCPECDTCRRWWKPLMEGELGQSVTDGYAGPVLEGLGNTVTYRFTMMYDIPAGIRTSRGVLRWHYVTTNSCTSQSSSPEEFWNCADVAVADSEGDTGDDVVFDNDELENMLVENLMPRITASPSGLKGLYYGCPRDSEGQLISVGSESEYQNCGMDLESCVDLSGGAGEASAVCAPPRPASGYICDEQCSQYWYSCDTNGFATKQLMAAGTLCLNNNSVLLAECASSTAAPSPGGPGGNEPCSSCWPDCPVPLCVAECSDFWVECWEGGSQQQPVPAGSKCKDNEFVLDAECPARRLGSSDIVLTRPMYF